MNILISGFAGRMGQAIYNCSKTMEDVTVTEGLVLDSMVAETQKNNPNIKIFSDINCSKNCDAIIDFSHHSLLPTLIDFCVKNNKPLVVGTTGITEEELSLIKEASKKIAIFRSSNMSEGVYVLLNLIKKATQMLPEWDIEIIEKHHNQKADAPSGTALMMTGEVSAVRQEAELVFGRNPASPKRSKNEIGVHAIRGGGAIGEHEIDFFSKSETIKITHEAYSKEVFAMGALKASLFVVKQKPGFYEMKNLFE